MRLNLENGHTFTIVGKTDGITPATLNDKPLTEYAISHQNIINGDSLVLPKTK